MGVTIKDIARKLGVSTTTVSLVLNNKPSRISPETRQAVLQAAAELNYHPNQIAVSMVTRRTGTIGLLLPDISNLYFSSLAKVIESECSALGYNVLYGNTNDSVENDFKYLELFLLGRAVDAVILTPSYQLGEEERIRFRGLVESSSIPVVTVDRRMQQMEVPCVCVDQELGGYLATKHLLSLGHRRIGCITAQPNVSGSAERLRGYRRALEEAGVPFEPALVVAGNYHVESGIQALPILLGQEVSAIFAANDMMAIGVLRECRRFHLRVPEDLSVVGFDDIFLAEFLEPPLTTVYQPLEEIGREAVHQAAEMLHGAPGGERIISFKPSLRIRGSTMRWAGAQETAGK